MTMSHEVVRLIESSRVFGVADRALGGVGRAAGSSRVVGAATRTVTKWRGLAPSMRRRATGAALIVAVVVHVGLTMSHETPPGWFWLILPGFVAALGGLLLAASGATDRPGERH